MAGIIFALALTRAALVSIIPAAISLFLWLALYERPTWHPPPTPPWHPDFWRFLLHLCASGLGHDAAGLAAALIPSALVGIPLLWLLSRRRAPVALTAFATALLAFLAAIATARAALGLENARLSRYAEIASLLIPCAAAAWHLVLADRPWLRRAALAALGVWCLLGFYDRFNFPNAYRPIKRDRAAGLACLRTATTCPTIYPRSLAERLDRARHLDVRFTRAL